MRYTEKSAPPPAAEPDEFVMSDGSVDRMGDVIEPSGWQLDAIKSDPVVLFNHDKHQILGSWADIRVKDGKLLGRIQWTKSNKWPFAQYIRDLVREGHLRTVSVGFRSLERKPLDEKADKSFGPFRFVKQELLECSLVSVPANPNALAVVKDMPRDLIAEIFRKPATEDLDRSSADHGKPAAKPLVQKSTIMQTASIITNKINAAQQNLNALRDAYEDLVRKEEHDADEAKRYKELPDLIEAAKAEIEAHRRAERILVENASGQREPDPIRTPPAEILAPAPAPVKEPPSDSGRVWAMPRAKIEVGDHTFRALAAWTKSQAAHDPDIGRTLRDLYPTSNNELTNIVLRAAVNPAQTTVATWAAELMRTDTAAAVDRLIPDSIYLPLSTMGVRYTFGTANKINIPVRANSPTIAGNWVGEGAPKPVRRASFSTVPLVPAKLSVISTFTEEMATYSANLIEQIIRQAMSDDTSVALDTFLIDNVAGSATRPAGLLNGVTPITASAATPATAAMVADIKALVAAIIAAGGGRRVAVLLNPAQALSLGFAQTSTGDFLFQDTAQAGSKFNVRFVVSATVPAGRVIAVDAADFATATGDTPRFAVSTDATLHEEDTTPLAIGTVGAPATVAAPTRSLFQTDAVAIRMSLYVTWVMRRAGMVQTIASVTW